MKKRLTVYKSKRLVALALLISSIIPLPIAAFTKYSIKKNYSDSFQTLNSFLRSNNTKVKETQIDSLFTVNGQCNEIWPQYIDIKIHNLYNLFLLSIQYILPLMTVIIAYTLIGLKFKSDDRFSSEICRKKQKKKVN
jgi:hypothetical protein